MLCALLGAICAASLAFAPVSASASVNAGLTPTVHSAYYDSSAVAEYGTEAEGLYNYSSLTLHYGGTSSNPNANTLEPNSTVYNNGYFYFAENYPVDIYVNGVFVTTLLETKSLRLNEGEEDYTWFFDHQVYELGTDTVGDIAEGLTSGIGTVATGIGGGLQSLVRNIFLVGTVDEETGAFTATGLSTFGIVTVAFCGLALALGLSRWIVGFASSLGSRNR